MRCLDGITDSVDVNFSKFREIVKAREGWCATVHRSQSVGLVLATVFKTTIVAQFELPGWH